MNTTTLFGIDLLLTQAANYKNKRIGLVCNAASLTSLGTHTRVALQEAGFQIVRLFAPEHGFDSQGVDGAYIDDNIDALTQIPIVSLYSKKLAPSAADLADLDLVIVDLPDIGARFYTYLWTMTYVMESCEQYGTPALVLDRPNPMAKDISLAEGPILTPSCASFIGRFPIPITHHCTFGELAKYFQANYFPNLDLQILFMEHWNRSINSNYPFFPTSPAIQRRETVYTYAGACLFEGLSIHEGRETASPFAQFGAPWIDADRLFLAASKLADNVILERVHYTASISIYQGETCHGLRVIPQDPKTFLSVAYFTKLIALIDHLFPNQLQERDYLTNVNPTGTKHLDLLLGIPNAFESIITGKYQTELKTEEWIEKIKPFIHY
ncbi:DUF1343 domain-containing protein [Sphingobacteriaceae bacterium WQ 2009]|uniref:DUF1343 domain-containing protein n=1 Tax=Rhinopithecimicrobium faecis TaxID=2820698 RepID=A0A8T4HDX6_9SPHI|nr:DUF1343 domain-containing protein [Sphingobacteriaceae bacterium WQ 2009]